MAANTQRTSINVPTITVVDSVQRDRKIARNCCGCIPERIGVFAILSVYFFLGSFYSLASFAGLSITSDAAVIALYVISGCLYAFIAIVSAMSANAIRKEKVVMMRHLSIVFWILTALMLIFSIVVYALLVAFRSSLIQACNNSALETYGENGTNFVNCNRAVDDTLLSEAIRTFATGIISIYFAYVIFRYAKLMKETQNQDVLIMEAAPKTPTYFVYTTQPPTSNNWVPPPIYTVRATNPLPDDFNPDQKQTSN